MIIEYNRLICKLRKLEMYRNFCKGDLQRFVDDEISQIKGRINFLEKVILKDENVESFDMKLIYF